MELVLFVLVTLGLGAFALARRTRGRIVIVWGEGWPAVDDDAVPTIRLASPPTALTGPSPWERELQRRLRRRVLTLPPGGAASRPFDAHAVGEGCYRLLPPAQEK